MTNPSCYTLDISWHLLTLFASTPSAEPLQFHQLRRFLHLRLDHLDEVAIRRHDLGTPLQILEMAMHGLVQATETKNEAQP